MLPAKRNEDDDDGGGEWEGSRDADPTRRNFSSEVGVEVEVKTPNTRGLVPRLERGWGGGHVRQDGVDTKEDGVGGPK